MSIINFTHDFVFVHIPKTAGTSITSTLSKYSQYCDIEIGGTVFGEEIQAPYRRRYGLSKHSTADRLRSLIGHRDWARMYTFSFVRNPYARAASAFNFLKQWDGCPPNFKNIIGQFATFEEFVLSEIFDQVTGPDDMFCPQARWLTASGSDKLLVDRVGKIEQLDTDLEQILKLAIPSKTIVESAPHLNRSEDRERLMLDAYRNSEVVDSVRARYAIDFELFSYSTDPEEMIAP